MDTTQTYQIRVGDVVLAHHGLLLSVKECEVCAVASHIQDPAGLSYKLRPVTGWFRKSLWVPMADVRAIVSSTAERRRQSEIEQLERWISL